MMKAIWKLFVKMIKDFHQNGFNIFRKRKPIDHKAIMKDLQKQARKQHLDKMAKARGGKKRKRIEIIFHNTKVLGTYRRQSRKIGRNEPCPCGSELKSKKCCLA